MSERVCVNVGGQEFYLKSDRDKEYLLGLADEVNRRIDEKCRLSSSVSPAKASVLVAMELMDELQQLDDDYKAFNEEVKSIVF